MERMKTKREIETLKVRIDMLDHELRMALNTLHLIEEQMLDEEEWKKIGLNQSWKYGLATSII